MNKNLLILRPRPRAGHHYIAVPNGHRHRRYSLWRITENMASIRTAEEIRRSGCILGEGKALLIGVDLSLETCRELISKQKRKRK